MTRAAAELLGAYALGAVDQRERRVVERALGRDALLRAELDETLDTIGMLDRMVVAEVPPADPGVWGRIRGEISRDDNVEHDVIPLRARRRWRLG